MDIIENPMICDFYLLNKGWINWDGKCPVCENSLVFESPIWSKWCTLGGKFALGQLMQCPKCKAYVPTKSLSGFYSTTADHYTIIATASTRTEFG